MTQQADVQRLAPGETVAIELDGQPVAVANVDGQLYAFDDLCTHRQCSLSEGTLTGKVIACPCHNSTFDVTTGEVLGGPARRPLTTYPVESVATGISPLAEAPEVPTAAVTPEEQAEAEDALSHVSLFSGLDAASLHTLQSLTFRRDFPAGELIIEEGRVGNGLYVVLSGRVEVIRGLPDRPQVLATFGPGEPFGELALLGDWKRTASVQAVDDTVCLGIDRWVFLGYLRHHPELTERMMHVLAERLVDTDSMLAIEALQGIAQRLVEADQRVFG